MDKNRKKPGPKPGSPAALRMSRMNSTEIDWERAEKLAAVFCPVMDICYILKITHDALARACKRKFKKTPAEWAEERRGNTRAAIRSKQVQLALAGDKTMLVWCGKNLLGQSDHNRLNVAGKVESSEVSLYLKKIEQMSQQQRLEEISRFRSLREETAGE